MTPKSFYASEDARMWGEIRASFAHPLFLWLLGRISLVMVCVMVVDYFRFS